MTTIQFLPKSSIIRQFIAEFKPWIEEQLGVSMSETIQLRFDQEISILAASKLLPKTTLAGDETAIEKIFEDRFTGVEFPPECTPAVCLKLVPDETSSFASGKKIWRAHWLDCPVAIRLRGLTSPVIVMHVPFVVGADSSGDWREVVLVRRDNAEAVLEFAKQASTAIQEPGLHFQGNGIEKVRSVEWNDLILAPSIERLLRADYESFLQREAWFRQNHLPFRRGYLLYGPPGNGKTSAIRAMLSRRGIAGFTTNLFRQDINDDDLTLLFQAAASSAPAIVVLEDIDRYFDQKRDERPEGKVSLQHLLNCLDGATTRDGVIVVATANNPQVLDPAILRRPGRFDRVVGFANPTKDLRVRYLQKMSVDADVASIDTCADAGEGFSFAQLQESYILAGQFAFDEQRSITAEDILTAIHTLRKSLQCADWKGEGAPGFKVERR